MRAITTPAVASKAILNRVLAGAVVFLLAAAAHAAPPTTLTWHGHAAFEIVTPKGAVIMIDPWLKNPVNPNAKDDQDPLVAVKKLDYIVLTHGHFDHVGDAVALAKQTGARLVTNFELGSNMAKVLGFPKEQMGFDTLMNIGGEIGLADGEVTVALTPAVHSSGLGDPNAGAQQPDAIYGGNPAGVVIVIKNGPTIYHSGDTAYFSDMSLIGDVYAPDVALINAGGHFGMEPPMAARAAGAVRAPVVIAQHYGTFPVLAPDTRAFAAAVRKRGLRFVDLKPGATLRFDGRRLLPQKK